jgi:hypothetical protein
MRWGLDLSGCLTSRAWIIIERALCAELST